jgi:hypothetical protein
MVMSLCSPNDEDFWDDDYYKYPVGEADDNWEWDDDDEMVWDEED